MNRITRCLVASWGSFLLTSACGGGGDGITSPPPPPPPAFSYSLSNSGTVTVQKNNSASVSAQASVTKTLMAGTSQAVGLTLSALPSGVTSTLGNGDCSPTCQATITLTIASSTEGGSYPITVTGSPNNATTSFTLTVTLPPVSNTRDTINVVLAPADSLDSAPAGIFADFVSTDSVSVAYTSWYAASSPLSVPKGATGKLCVRGGEKYESRCWTNVTASSGGRFAAILHPNCWTGRQGDVAGQTRCLTRAQVIAKPGVEGYGFYNGNAGVKSPWGWREDLLPAKVMLADPYSAGQNWSAEDSTFVASQITSVNQAWGRTLLVMGGRATDTLFVADQINVVRALDNSSPNTGRASGDAGDITSGRVTMAKDGLRSPGTLAHEFMHTLGFGHTCEWVSRMASSAACQSKLPANMWFTADDITGFQMAYAIRAQAKRINANLSYF